MKKILLRMSAILTIFILTIGFITITFLMKSERPRVALIFTQNESIPDIAFKVSSIPLALASFFNFGTPSFVAIPATDKNIHQALSDLEFVVIGTHGRDGKIYSDDSGWHGPSEKVNSKMRGIYFGSCFFGAKRKAWEAMFPNAKVIGYDAITTPLSGWRYLVFKSWLDLIKVKFD